ncbi:ATP-binding protein [Aestuariibius insulae]|uniref:ATP-binding protein n=1 Tax=Aestuariibius insulae TaxID=2058287 RepID=UPI00345E597C
MSLRLRLFLIIVCPLLLVALALGFWRVAQAEATAEELFDRDLLFTAVAVARDVALLDGDAVSRETGALLSDAAGGPIRYHVYAPDGVFVTGYAVPPIPVSGVPETEAPFVLYDGIYKGRDVRVLRLWDVGQIGGLSGTFTITVWQDAAIRQDYVRETAINVIAVMAALIGAVALCVWFGVKLGLKPLLDLEDAISRRSPDDLTPIRRRVPPEADGIVTQLNSLIGQIRTTMTAQTDFISNAAHQLRNPLAGIRALGDSIMTAGSLSAAKARAGDLIEAAGQASDLANRLLTLERMRAGSAGAGFEAVDLAVITVQAAQGFEERAEAAGVTVDIVRPERDCLIDGDPVMLREAIVNLIGNALAHGGPDLTRLSITLDRSGDIVRLMLEDDGRGLEEKDIDRALARFGQAQPGRGSGLGLPIAEAVVAQHGGSLALDTGGPGLRVTLDFPVLERVGAI